MPGFKQLAKDVLGPPLPVDKFRLAGSVPIAGSQYSTCHIHHIVKCIFLLFWRDNTKL